MITAELYGYNSVTTMPNNISRLLARRCATPEFNRDTACSITILVSTFSQTGYVALVSPFLVAGVTTMRKLAAAKIIETCSA